jgi:hypothetical protein
MDDFFRLVLAPDPLLPWQAVMLSLVNSFLASMAVAWVYIRTHQGLSYSRAFVQTLVLASLVASMLMLAVGNNLARGVAILGSMALIRFRSTMKDPRDMVFVFASLAAGISMGVRAYAVGLTGTAVFGAAAWLLKYTDFGAREHHDGLVRVLLPTESNGEVIRAVLDHHCRRWVLVTLRETEGGRVAEQNYHVALHDPNNPGAFLDDLQKLPGAKGVTFFSQEAAVDF